MAKQVTKELVRAFEEIVCLRAEKRELLEALEGLLKDHGHWKTENVKKARALVFKHRKDTCDRCGAEQVRDVLDGDRLCQSCCDKWVRAEAQP